MARKFFLKTFLIIALGVGVIAAGGGHVDRFLHKIGMAGISASNQQYLQNSFDRATRGFLVLSGIKSGLAVIEGSEVGIGFSLELGDIVQSIYDYVDIAWKTALAGGTVLLLTRLTLDMVNIIDHLFLSIMLFLVMLAMIIHWIFPNAVRISRFLREAVLFFVVLTITLYIILPVSITGATFLSRTISQPLIQETQDEFSSIQDEFSSESLNKRLFPGSTSKEKNWYSRFDIAGNMESLKRHMASLRVYFEEKTKQVAVWTIKLIAGYLFDCIIFPLTFLLILFIFTKSMLRYFLGISRGASFRDDMERIFSKYYDKRKPMKKPASHGG